MSEISYFIIKDIVRSYSYVQQILILILCDLMGEICMSDYKYGKIVFTINN